MLPLACEYHDHAIFMWLIFLSSWLDALRWIGKLTSCAHMGSFGLVILTWWFTVALLVARQLLVYDTSTVHIGDWKYFLCSVPNAEWYTNQCGKDLERLLPNFSCGQRTQLWESSVNIVWLFRSAMRLHRLRKQIIQQNDAMDLNII